MKFITAFYLKLFYNDSSFVKTLTNCKKLTDKHQNFGINWYKLFQHQMCKSLHSGRDCIICNTQMNKYKFIVKQNQIQSFVKLWQEMSGKLFLYFCICILIIIRIHAMCLK